MDFSVGFKNEVAGEMKNAKTLVLKMAEFKSPKSIPKILLLHPPIAGTNFTD